MTALTTSPGVPLRAGSAGIPMTRLVRVELRKLLDTRSGAWLLAGIALVTAGAVLLYLFTTDASGLTFEHLVNVTVLPQALLLPLLGIMAVTGEWTQRTGLVTHTLEPRRGRVLAAKFAATGILGVASVVLTLALAAAANVAGSAWLEGTGSWAYGLRGVGDTLLFVALSLLQGLAVGTLLMNTAAAIVAYAVLPTAFTLLFSMVDGLRDKAGWIDLSASQDPLFRHSLAGVEWLQLLATTVWWILLPLAAGVWRLLHREIT
jgi:ABC-type transport system involved in multi-copper enzyme maturation permease subunit